MTESTTQLELFEALPQASRRPRSTFHIGMLSVRYDHLVLLLLMGLVAGSVVFALGVERGKRLARVEHMLLETPSVATAPATVEAKSPPTATKAAPVAEAIPSGTAATPAKVAPTKPLKTPVKVADSSAAKFAVQVVTFRQPTRAQQELRRLQRQGERAFLLKRSDRMTVFVGPFPSRANATSKLASLKVRYQDCFVKPL